jgi:hypothetical protein
MPADLKMTLPNGKSGIKRLRAQERLINADELNVRQEGMMIPREITANELLIEIIEAPTTQWTLQVMSTNWVGYWILQLSHRQQPPFALLIHLDNLAAICRAVRSCIDTAQTPQQFPGAETMFVTAASQLPTQKNEKGAVTVMSDWSSEPFLVLSYYRGGGHGDGNVIRQALTLDDALKISDLFTAVYNEFADKKDWKPRAAK